MDLAQISDFHVVEPGALAYGRVDTAEALRRAVEAVNRLDPPPTAVLCTGDLTQGGKDAEYALLRDILALLTPPVLPLLGNHDRRDGFRSAFADLGLASGPEDYIQYAHEFDDLRVLALDTVTEGSDQPSFDAARLDWLDAQLEIRKPTLLTLHHPPFECGVGWLEPADPTWGAAIGAAVARAPHVVGVLCGHVHRTMIRRWRGVHAATAPSTAHQVALHLSSDARPCLSNEAPGLLVHRWAGGELATYAASTMGFGDRFAPGSAA